MFGSCSAPSYFIIISEHAVKFNNKFYCVDAKVIFFYKTAKRMLFSARIAASHFRQEHARTMFSVRIIAELYGGETTEKSLKIVLTVPLFWSVSKALSMVNSGSIVSSIRSRHALICEGC